MSRLTIAMLIGLGSIVGLAFVPAALAVQIACDPGTSAPSASTSATPPASPAAVTATPFPEDGGTLTVFAAASLTDAFDEFATALETDNPGLDIVIETGGSQALVTQLQEGAEADVLATANTSTMDTAVESGLVEGEPSIFTGNRLVIVAPEGNPAGIDSLDDLAADGVLLVVANPAVPAGDYVRRALCAYDASGTAPDGFLDAVWSNVASEEEDVRNVLAKVQLGEADAGLVYASDAVASDLAGTPLTAIEFPTSVPTTASYPIAALSGGQTDVANAFIAAILAPEGQGILSKYGFER